MIKSLFLVLNSMEFHPFRWMRNFKSIFWYLKDYRTFKKLIKNNKDFALLSMYPVILDKYSSSGTYSGHYFHQDYFVAKKILENKPLRHVDIGSRVDGFVTHVAVFREIEVFDIRPLNCKVSNIKFKKADLMEINNELENYTDSISCLHALEHFGLGRYNDPLDPMGHIKGFNNISKILKKRGVFYFSVPFGPQRIEFNAHRVFSLDYLLSLFLNKFDIRSFSYVDDNGDLHENVDLLESNVKNNFNCIWGCAIFELIKI